MAPLLAGIRLQAGLIRTYSDYWMVPLTNPLLAIVFLAIVDNAGRPDLLGHALLAPALLGLWSMSLFVSGETVETERYFGTLELNVAAPSDVAANIVGRIITVTAIALLSFLESWLVAWLLFGEVVSVSHPLLFAVTLAVTAVAMAGTALVMAAVFVLARSARIFQNSLSYPFYLLGGVFVPVELLPGWVEPISRAVFLSWSADLLRDSLGSATVEDFGFRCAVIAALGVAGFVFGRYLLRRVVRRLLRLGTVTYA